MEEKIVVLASNNIHKIKEFREVLKGVHILSLGEIGYRKEIEENGSAFLENALIKAKTICHYLKEKGYDYDVIADDSGLCVNALGGQPGVNSARYAKDHNDQANRNKLLKELEGKNDRSAYFLCDIVRYHSNDTYESYEGRVEGVITTEERGKTDFGYDCLFLSNELGKTFGEATEEEKNAVSHRARAIHQMITEER